ncbi:MAG: MerR family transcriptional regulator [Candidatus Omnitrophota bacterium]
MENKLTIGQVAAKAAISPQTIRLWIKQFLIKEPHRSWAGYRLFTNKDLEEILRVKKLHFQINVKIGQENARCLRSLSEKIRQQTNKSIKKIVKSALIKPGKENDEA